MSMVENHIEMLLQLCRNVILLYDQYDVIEADLNPLRSASIEPINQKNCLFKNVLDILRYPMKKRPKEGENFFSKRGKNERRNENVIQNCLKVIDA